MNRRSLFGMFLLPFVPVAVVAAKAKEPDMGFLVPAAFGEKIIVLRRDMKFIEQREFRVDEIYQVRK